jgi:hypothetical protein
MSVLLTRQSPRFATWFGPALLVVFAMATTASLPRLAAAQWFCPTMRDLGTFSGQAARNSIPNAHAAATDDGDFSLQSKIH